VAVLWTNALPIAAGMALYGEGLPAGWRGGVRVVAFLLVVGAAFALGGSERLRATPAAAESPG
jgi:hypothetical protein